MHLSVSRSQYYFLNFQCSILLGWIGIGMDGTRFCSRNNRNWLDFLRLFQDLPMWYFIFTEFFFYLAQEMIRRNCDCVPTVFCRGYFFGCFFLLGFTGFFFTVGSLVRTSPSRGHKSVDCGKNCCDTPPCWSTTTGYYLKPLFICKICLSGSKKKPKSQLFILCNSILSIIFVF